MKTTRIILSSAVVLISSISLLLSAGCSEETSQPVIKPKIEIIIASGNEQKGTSGEWLNQSIKIQVMDEDHVPIPGVKVYFNIVEGSGEADNSWIASDDLGKAEIRWKPGREIFQTVGISLDESLFEFDPVYVQAYNERWAFISIVSGNSQTGRQGEVLAQPIIFKVTDIDNNPLPNIHVDFQIIAGGGNLNVATPYTDSEGKIEIHSTLGSGLYQRVKISLTDQFYYARYMFIQSNVISQIELPSGYKWTTYNNAIEWGSGNQITHDNKVLESDNFLVFSDACSDEVKIQYAVMAEDSWSELMQLFGINSGEELGIYTDNPVSKMKLYCSKSTTIQMCAFPEGFLLYDINHSVWHTSPWAPMRHKCYRNIIKHEAMHVLEFHLIENGSWPPFWFSEGIAEYTSGGSFYHIETITKLNDWFEQPNHIVPVGIGYPQDEIPNANPDLIGQYYPMFGLAVEYLLDPRGLGKSIDDVKTIFNDVKQGIPFEASFQNRMGISVEYYKTNFRDLINRFFTKYEANN